MRRTNRGKKYIIFLFLIWPLIGLISAIKNYNKFKTKNIILGFCALYGFTLVIDPVADSERYAIRLLKAYGKPFLETPLYEHLTGLFHTYLDFVEPLITFLVSRITDSAHILFAVYALVFGFFWLKSIEFVNKRYKFSENYLTILYTIFFISIIPISQITGFRMWTAAWVFIYGAFFVIFEQKRKYLLVCLSACFIHFSFLGPNVILIFWVFLGNHKWTYLILALLSFFVIEINLSTIRSLLDGINPALTAKANGYAGDEYAAKVAQLKSTSYDWYMLLSPILTRYLLLINVLLFFFQALKRELPRAELNLLNFTLLFVTFANISSSMPSGGRFQSVYDVFAVALSIILFSKYYYRKWTSVYSLVSMGIILLFVLIKFRIATASINTALLGPGILIPFGYDLNWPVVNWLF